jgi:hypothetical protein
MRAPGYSGSLECVAAVRTVPRAKLAKTSFTPVRK